MSTGTQVRRVVRPIAVASGSTTRTRVGGDATKRTRVVARVTSGKAGGVRKKVSP